MKDQLNGLAFIIFLILILTIFVFYGIKSDKDFQNKLSQKNLE